jgi:hypothetical protein
MKNIFKNFSSFLVVAVTVSMFSACKKQNIVDRGLTDTNLDASFTLTTVDANNYVARVKDSSYIFSKWDLGNGSGAAIGKSTQPVFLPDAGTYTITHYAVGKGGATFTSAQTITVATSDPARGNLVQGGKFETAADESKWTRLIIGAPAITWTLSGGKMVATGGSFGHSAIYQTIQVEANKDYRFAMTVSGSGATDTWFEVYFGTTVPVQNSDYTSGGIRIALNTWTGCGNTTFNGNIATIGCAGSLVGQNGKVRFTQAGTIYLLIKTGGANLGTSGISIDNVELRGI